MRPLVHTALTVFVLSTIACSHGSDNPRSVPSVLRERAANEEIVPYDGFTIAGLRLFRASGAVPDHGWSYIVGVDRDGALVEREALMARLGPLDPETFAVRAIAILLREEGQRPLLPTDERPQFVSEAGFEVVTAPRREGDTIIFFVMEGEMSPRLVEVRVDATTYAVTQRSGDDVLLALGRVVETNIPLCQPYATCGCYDGCRRFTSVRVPPSGDVRFRLEDDAERPLFAPAAACTGARCARVCRVDAPTANCDPALVRENEPCTEACPPSEAPYHCETLVSGCRVVPHPVRAQMPH